MMTGGSAETKASRQATDQPAHPVASPDVRAALRIMVKAVKDDDRVGQTFNIAVCSALGLIIGAVMLEFD